ncbi:MAG: recombination mediator RecR [Floccifex porci]|uniref:Recombination protein RecR n=1 Tax=Floccifex porci TaxID=2606629 RepID=A0A7X2T3P7_9FIRM|nr:recombination mediator RecR [Floccifex porci]MDD7467189.1 recombination mediator RecR [Floccifex porci]MDO4480222.1 recombination mediator RecR [Erysipelotrichaceae bacterium]MSS00921.1 recombination protein RecR [Floccifex porci]
MYPKKFQNMIDSYQKLPGVGKKTAERYAFKTLDWDEETLDQFIQSLTDLKKGITYCHICGNLSEEDICDICKNENRNHNCICVVQNPKNIDSIEAMQEFNGVYHVLNGTINVSKGVLPEQLNIQSLINRINEDTEEVILALDPTADGETTSMYISKLLNNKCKVTKLANGIPLGSHLDYTDPLTLLKAFQKRSNN